MALFNPDDVTTQVIGIDFADAGLDGGKPVAVRDLWLHEDLGVYTRTFNATVAPHRVTMVLLQQ